MSDSARRREEAEFELRGVTPRARRLSAQALVNLARTLDEEPEQWVLDVAEGRLPA